MAVVSVVSAKGGVGKTTLAVNFAAELARRGTSVCVVDCDLNQHATRFGVPFSAVNPQLRLRFIANVNRTTIYDAIRDGEASSEIVIVDLPAGTSEVALKAMMKSHLVVIPAQKTVFDVRDAARTAIQLTEAEDSVRASIPSVLLWTRVPARFETRTERQVRQDFLSMLDRPEQAVLEVSMLEYDAFQAGFEATWAPFQVADHAGQEATVKTVNGPVQRSIPRSAAKAAENMQAITDALLRRLDLVAEADSGGPLPRMSLRPDVLKAVKADRRFEVTE